MKFALKFSQISIYIYTQRLKHAHTKIHTTCTTCICSTCSAEDTGTYQQVSTINDKHSIHHVLDPMYSDHESFKTKKEYITCLGMDLSLFYNFLHNLYLEMKWFN